MPISQEALFKIALNLEDSWYTVTTDIRAEGKQLDIHVGFKTGSKFPWVKCGKTNCNVHDTIERTWRHLNFFKFNTYIHFRIPRITCEDCGVKHSKGPRARRGSGFTLFMDYLIWFLAFLSR